MTTADVAFKDLDAFVQQLRGDLFARWMRRAQKAALLEWRDRKDPPGLAARFTAAGAAFYRFGPRSSYGVLNRIKGGTQHYVLTGGTRDMMAKRRPTAVRGTQDIVSRLKYGGGKLNFLTNVGAVTGRNVVRWRETVAVAGYTYKHHKTGATVSVSPGTSNRARKKVTFTRSATSYAADFGRFLRDSPWIADRTAVLFREIIRRAAFTKGGMLRSNMLQEVDRVG